MVEETETGSQSKRKVTVVEMNSAAKGMVGIFRDRSEMHSLTHIHTRILFHLERLARPELNSSVRAEVSCAHT